MSYNKLFYNQIDFRIEGKKIVAAPNFLCPVCSERPEHRINQDFSVNLNKPINFSNQVTFIMPCCNTPITLNVAVHKEKGEMPSLYIGVPEVPVPDDWWMN